MKLAISTSSPAWVRTVVTGLLMAGAVATLSDRSLASDTARSDVPPIVRKSIEFHGGDLFSASETKFRLCSKSGCSKVDARVDDGQFSLEASTLRDGKERRVRMTNNSTELWQAGELQEIPADELQRTRDWVMQRVYFAYLPYRLEDPSVRHQDLGLEDWGGDSLHKIKVTFESGTSTDADDQYMYWFEPETGRMVQFAYSYQGDPGGLRFRQLFNYRRYRGLVFHDQKNLGVEGPDLSVDQITPEFVEERLRQVSVIEVSEMSLNPLY